MKKITLLLAALAAACATSRTSGPVPEESKSAVESTIAETKPAPGLRETPAPTIKEEDFNRKLDRYVYVQFRSRLRAIDEKNDRMHSLAAAEALRRLLYGPNDK